MVLNGDDVDALEDIETQPRTLKSINFESSPPGSPSPTTIPQVSPATMNERAGTSSEEEKIRQVSPYVI